MSKTLTVATDVQKAVIKGVLLSELTNGFWKDARPANHAAAWKGLKVETGSHYGARDFNFLRNYDFVNPKLLALKQDQMLVVARAVKPDLTVPQLKEQLKLLSRIVGGRISQKDGPIAKLTRGPRKGYTRDAVGR